MAVDTTVMEKEYRAPDGFRLYGRARAQWVDLARQAGVELRQSYARLAPQLAAQVDRYAHAKQFRCMGKALRKLRGYTDACCATFAATLPMFPREPCVSWCWDKLVLVGRLLHQEPKSRNKIYALHEPMVDCISKGKARRHHQFGTKVSIAITLAVSSSACEGCRAIPMPHPGRGAGAGHNSHRLPTEARRRLPRLPGPWRRGDRRPDRRRPPRGYTRACESPPQAQQRRARDRTREDRRAAFTVLPQGHPR